ncbi:MAG TPA: hypothetical protein PKJ26_01585 [Candidatus Woesebacteria bacterium]|nr:hypothetical protein [Candidatus Woesebacteria bacterium]HNS65168.1 hypothetical protein [Candidatus Woesebacteria bacterium]
MEMISEEIFQPPESSPNLDAIEQQVDFAIATKSNIKKRIVTRLAMTVLVGALFLSACSTVETQGNPPPQYASATEFARTPIALSEESSHTYSPDRVIFEPYKELAPYAINLPAQLKEDLVKVIWHALQNNAATNIDPDDLFHCHVLMTQEKYKQNYDIDVYEGTLSGWLNGYAQDYSGLLCHSQEYANKGADPQKRNIVVMKGQEPFIPLATAGEGISIPELDDMMGGSRIGVLQLHFYITPDGKIKLPDGRRIDVVVESPGVYTSLRTKMSVDLPSVTE